MSAPEGTRSEAIEHEYAGSTETINQARTDLVEWLFAHSLDALTADAQLVVSELTSNAVEASPGVPYRVGAWLKPGALAIAVVNQTAAELPDEQDWTPESVLAPQGRGLLIVRALSESVDVDQIGMETTVTAILKIDD